MPRILVVEDDRDLNRLVCSCLRGEGHDVTSAPDGEEALAYLGEGKYDLLLTDIMMPKVDGFDLAEKAKLIDKNMPLVFMTAKDDKPSQMLGYRLGIDDYIVKPFDVDVLIMKIGAILRRAKIESEKTITVGNFSMNIEERTALIDGEEIALTVREFDLSCLTPKRLSQGRRLWKNFGILILRLLQGR